MNKLSVMSTPPSRDEIIDYFADPATGKPLRRDVLNSKTDKFLSRMAELSNGDFIKWLKDERSGKTNDNA